MTNKEAPVYCPHCRSSKPLWKAGFQLRVGGRPDQQRYYCRHCHRYTVNPKKNPPKSRAKK